MPTRSAIPAPHASPDPAPRSRCLASTTGLTGLVALALGWSATGSLATTVYRCPAPPGSTALALYTDQPCPRGQSVDARDDRLPEQQRAAQSRAREEARWVEQMARQRRQDERVQAAQQQRQVAVMDQPRVDISSNARAQAQRDAELRRLSRPPAQRDVPSPAPVPPPAAAGTAPTAKPGRL